MKAKDYRRLAKLSLASRKSTARSTVRGMSFGLILLIPVIFVAGALFGDLNAQINKNPDTLYASIKVAAERTGVPDYKGEYDYIISNSHAGGIEAAAEGSEVFRFEQLYARGGYEDQPWYACSVNSGELIPGTMPRERIDPHNVMYDYSARAFAALLPGGKDFVPQKLSKNYADGVFVPGMDKGFTGDGKGQVILSQMLLDHLELELEDVYGKSFSLMYVDGYGGGNVTHNTIVIDNDNNPANNTFESISSGEMYMNSKMLYLCQDFEVVGIIRSEVTEFATKSSSGASHMSNFMLFTNASAQLPDGKMLEPVITFYEHEEEAYNFQLLATYTQSESEFEELNKTYIAMGANNFTSVIQYPVDKKLFTQESLFIDTPSYAHLDSVMDGLRSELSFFIDDENSYMLSSFSSQIYSQLKMVYEIFTYMVMFLSIMGGIIFFAAVVNLFNSIVHSVDSRKYYLAVMRAIGAKDNMIPKLYMAESLTLFRRMLVWVLIFATAICAGIKLLLDQLFGYVNQSGIFPYTITINPWYIPIAIGAGLAVVLVLGFLFSWGCSRSVSKRPIMSLLGES